MRMGPNDKRALRRTGRQWEKDGFSGPVMVDGNGNEIECFSGSVADFTNGRLDAFLNRPGGLVEQLAARLAEEDGADG
jgi:hypothetical protein